MGIAKFNPVPVLGAKITKSSFTLSDSSEDNQNIMTTTTSAAFIDFGKDVREQSHRESFRAKMSMDGVGRLGGSDEADIGLMTRSATTHGMMYRPPSKEDLYVEFSRAPTVIFNFLFYFFFSKSTH